MNVSLEPVDLTVYEGEWAVFNCSIDCSHLRTHTINWLVGDAVIHMRTVYFSSGVIERRFLEQTGYQVMIEDHTNCGNTGGLVQQLLRINATSVSKVNKTAVQCAAFRKNPSDFDFLSYYAVLLVKGECQCVFVVVIHDSLYLSTNLCRCVTL